MNVTMSPQQYLDFQTFQNITIPDEAEIAGFDYNGNVKFRRKRTLKSTKPKKSALRKGKCACHCNHDGCETNAYWRWYSQEFCAKHLPKKAKELKDAGEYGYTEDNKLAWA